MVAVNLNGSGQLKSLQGAGVRSIPPKSGIRTKRRAMAWSLLQS